MIPQYVKIGEEKYKINTSYKIALKCDQIFRDEQILPYEKLLAIIYLLFGEKGLKDKNNHGKLYELAIKFLSCGEEQQDDNEKPDMDFQQDFNLIKASFKSDFNIDLSKEDLHFWDFYTYLNGLKEDCILNRVRTIRTYDASKIKDAKDRNDILKMKQRFKLKNQQSKPSSDQNKVAEQFWKEMGY